MFEIASRFMVWSSNPGLVYYSQSGSVNGGKNCPESVVQPPRCREEWTLASEGLSPWKPTKKDVEFWRDELFLSYKEFGSTAGR